MYQRWSKKAGVDCQILELRTAAPGVRGAVLRLHGQRAGELLAEGGTHRIQHKTRSRSKDRIHTSTATVAVLPVPSSTEYELKGNEVKLEAYRGSGKGGQHRNKTENAIRATHLPTGLQASSDGRSKEANRKAALEVLSARVAAQKQEQATQLRQQARARQTVAERARAVRTYDVVRDVIRCEDGRKVRGVERVLNGALQPLLN